MRGWWGGFAKLMFLPNSPHRIVALGTALQKGRDD